MGRLLISAQLSVFSYPYIADKNTINCKRLTQNRVFGLAFVMPMVHSIKFQS